MYYVLGLKGSQALLCTMYYVLCIRLTRLSSATIYYLLCTCTMYYVLCIRLERPSSATKPTKRRPSLIGRSNTIMVRWIYALINKGRPTAKQWYRHICHLNIYTLAWEARQRANQCNSTSRSSWLAYMYLICMYVCMCVCMYVCMYVRTYVCMYACMHVCMCIYIYIYV